MINIVKKEIIDSGGIENYLCAQQKKTLLRFLTCGSVDDGKSTLIGRLLHDSKKIYEDQLSLLYKDSKKTNAQNNKLDLALLVDGLESEREQGITIDVAYRYFFTEKRKFIIADVPGHEEYTRNMVTGASTSELAVLLLDARKGMRQQTKRHCLIITLLGIRNIIVVINKMDLVNYDQGVFNKIYEEYLEYTKLLFENYDFKIKFVPIVAVDGDNIVIPSINMQWYNGPTLLNILENIQIDPVISSESQKFRFPIQYVVRDNLDFRGYAGMVSSGIMYVGQKVRVFPSYTTAVIRRIFIFDKDKKQVWPGESVIVTLEDDIDISRGDYLVNADENIESVKCALVDIIWMTKRELKKGQNFYVKIATKFLRVQIESIEYQIDVNTYLQIKKDTISLNCIGLIRLLFDEWLILDKYSNYPTTGSMIFVDMFTNETVGAGMVRQPVKDFNVIDNKKYNTFELELHALMRRYFPHWKIHDLL